MQIVVCSDPGASPEEVETEITSEKIEDSVNTISQVDEVRSAELSSEGQSLSDHHVRAFEKRRRGGAGGGAGTRST